MIATDKKYRFATRRNCSYRPFGKNVAGLYFPVLIELLLNRYAIGRSFVSFGLSAPRTRAGATRLGAPPAQFIHDRARSLHLLVRHAHRARGNSRRSARVRFRARDASRAREDAIESMGARGRWRRSAAGALAPRSRGGARRAAERSREREGHEWSRARGQRPCAPAACV